MTGAVSLRALVFLTILIPGPFAVAAEDRSLDQVLIEWRFNEAGNLRGWQAGGHIAEAAVRDGALHGRASDWDPILLGPVFEIPARPTQRVEIRMRASEAGRAELFWTETLEGQYGGFSQEKAESLSVSAGAEFRDHRIAPFWHAAGKVVHLRFDPPNARTFGIAWIRILDSPTSAIETTAWDFRHGDHGWQTWQQIDRAVATQGGLQLTLAGSEPVWASPPLRIPVEELGFLAIRMSVDGGEKGRVFCVQDAQSGRESIDFRLIADGRVHTYNLEMATLSRWRDYIVMLGIQPSDAAGAEVCIESVVLAAEPVGPPEMQVAFFGSAAIATWNIGSTKPTPRRGIAATCNGPRCGPTTTRQVPTRAKTGGR